MNRKKLTYVLCLVLLSVPLSAQTETATEAWLSWFGDGVSEHAGTTAFPLLGISAGGRVEAMAGAYVAVGGDAGALESNPAGTSLADGAQLSFFHHEWMADSAVESAAFVASIGPVGFGAGLKYFRVPFTAYDTAGERVSGGEVTEIVGTLNLSLQFLAAERFSLAVGAGVKPAGRHVPDRIVAGQSGIAIPFDLGILSGLRLLDFSATGKRNLSVGLALRNIGPVVEFLDAPLPTAVSGGIAYRPFRFLLLSGEASVGVDLARMALLWDELAYGVGASVELAPFLAVHGGARVKTGNPRFALGTRLGLGKISVDVAYSVDLARGANPLDSLSIGATLDVGRKRDRGVMP
jgi:hypothetical protein